jgi:hypothetical protein
MSFPRLLTAALVLAIAVPVTASAQDRRSPDAADPIPSMEMSVQRDNAAPDAPIVQEMRTLGRRDSTVTPAPHQEAPSTSPESFPWTEAAASAALALALIGLTLVIALRRRTAARA